MHTKLQMMTEEQFTRLLNRVGNNPAQGPQGGRRKVSIFSSGDGEEWLTWKENFRYTAAINEWNPLRQRREMVAAMEGAAAGRVHDLGIGPDGTTPDQLLAMYQTRFIPQAATQLAQAEFRVAAQKPNELMLDWHTRLRRVYVQAFPDQENLENDPHLKDRFIAGLANKSIARHIFDHLPQGYTECLAIGQNKLATETKLQSYAAPQNNAQLYNMTLDIPDRALLASMETAKNLGHSAPQDKFKKKWPRRGGETKNAPGTCWGCGEQGHLKRDCSKSRDQATARPERGGTGQNGRRKWVNGIMEEEEISKFFDPSPAGN